MMTNDTSVLIVATIVGILTTFLAFSFEDIVLGGMLSDTVNISLALLIGGTAHLLALYFLVKRGKTITSFSDKQ